MFIAHHNYGNFAASWFPIHSDLLVAPCRSCQEMKSLSKSFLALDPIINDFVEQSTRGAWDVDEADLSRTSQKDQATSRIVAPGGSVGTRSKPVRACPKWLRR
jgi:hypothetical protein